MKKYPSILCDNIKKYSNCIWTPKTNINYTQLKNNTWFDHFQYNDSNIYFKNKKLNIEKFKKKQDIRKCIKVDMYPTKLQKQILNRWFKTYILMYNETLKTIKQKVKNDKNFDVVYTTLRTKYLKQFRNSLINDSGIDINIDGKHYDSEIYTHILDTAIKLACANYNSIITNFKRGNIKKYRIRYWRLNKKNKILEIERGYIINNSICPNRLGEIKCFYDGKPFNINDIVTKYKSDIKLLYNEETKQYTILIAEHVEINDEEKTNKVIILDPGIRAFLTGISENGIEKIGTNLSEKISKLIKKKENIELTKKIINKKNNIKWLNLKIKYLIDELHWKTANYLTKKYETILIGDMSSKSIISKKNNKISPITKKVAQMMSLYKFKQRLQFKCQINKCNYKEVNEYMTSKTCSKCTWINKNLEGNKVFECQNCKIKIDRDINASRNIYI